MQRVVWGSWGDAMGQARNRGDFETRKAEAIKAGRIKVKKVRYQPDHGFFLELVGNWMLRGLRKKKISRLC